MECTGVYPPGEGQPDTVWPAGWAPAGESAQEPAGRAARAARLPGGGHAEEGRERRPLRECGRSMEGSYVWGQWASHRGPKKKRKFTLRLRLCATVVEKGAGVHGVTLAGGQ